MTALFLQHNGVNLCSQAVDNPWGVQQRAEDRGDAAPEALSNPSGRNRTHCCRFLQLVYPSKTNPGHSAFSTSLLP